MSEIILLCAFIVVGVILLSLEGITALYALAGILVLVAVGVAFYQAWIITHLPVTKQPPKKRK